MSGTLKKQMEIRRILKDALDSGMLEASCVVSDTGLPIFSVIADPAKESILSAMAAAMLATGERLVEELKEGKLAYVTIQADDGLTVVRGAGKNQLIIGTARSKAGLQLIHQTLQRASSKLAELLEGE
jgi:predicted regulator of Ras-like GTPase activity (Roadblock/LC7/MglB family)